MIATIPICSIRPSMEAKPPPSPPMKPLPNSMPSKPAPRKPANMPPRKPGRLKKPPAGDGVGVRCPNVLPDCPGWVMLRSMGRAPGDVAVDGGAEKVCEPRLPKLPPRPARASASLTARANTATSAQNASSGRELKRDIDSSQETIRFDLTYWWSMTAFKEVPHGVADGLRSSRRERFRAKPWRYPHVHTAGDFVLGQFRGKPGSNRQRVRSVGGICSHAVAGNMA